ncbi:putative glyoxalase/bleomycin resistance protein [Frondihabitans sucicola]|uniref:Glyoxalase/bleomycin resistance protein n=1 Tax=Frondihabitans sucicola TaxID=1268041 RepID=A0ABM8GIM0_9MICO|nr:VOC family protein [Frondihabitans sucicola]BDZ48231.1 putative glyoxalase/bleomycin resistance protein [Frondihabitans sucicola]
MPTPTDFPTGAPLWIDLNSTDVEASKAFYGGLFGWTSFTAGPDFGDYVTFSLDGRQVAGMVENSEPDTIRDFWTVYLETDDAETTAQAVTGAGGFVIMGPHQVGPMGTMLLANDADRAVVGAWQRDEMRGFQAVAEPGAPAWFELHTTAFHDSVQFYQQAFGWETATMSDTPEFRYAQLKVGDDFYAGIMDASAYWPAGDPAQWMVYVNVADTDKAIARAVELGGAIVDEPADTPFGRLATISDATGALVKVIS